VANYFEKYRTPAPLRGFAQAAVSGIGSAAKGLATGTHELLSALDTEEDTPEAGASRLKAVQDNPVFAWGQAVQQAARELYPVSEEERGGLLTKAGEAAGGFLPLIASGPAAPITVGLQSMGDKLEKTFSDQIAEGKDPDEAAEHAFNQAKASGGFQAALFAVAPEPLRKLGDKMIVDKFGRGVVTKFLAGRVAQATEGAAIGGASQAGENVIEGKPVLEDVGPAAGGMAAVNALTPRPASKLLSSEELPPEATKPLALPGEEPPPPEAAKPLSLPVPEETPTAGKLLDESEVPAATPRDIPRSKILSSEAQEIPSGVMVSPNISDIQLQRAVKNLDSPEQGRMKAMAREAAPDAEVHDAVGDWADGAENSMAILFKDAKDQADLERISAKLGLAADQKAVLWWKADTAGKDAIHQVSWTKGTTLDQARQSLIDAGIENRTLVKTPDGFRAILFDQGRQLLNKLETLQDNELITDVSSHNATGDFLGSWTSRTEGRRAYRSILGSPEKTVEVPRRDLASPVGLGGQPEAPPGGGAGPSKPELLKNPEAWAEAVIKEAQGMASTGMNPELATAYAIKGSLIIGRGVRDFAQWSTEMVKQFGDGIKDHLQLIYKHANEVAEGRTPKLPLDEEADLGSRLGTRNPTAKSATESGHLHDTVVDLETMKKDPVLMAKAEKAIKDTFGYLNVGDDPIEGLIEHAKQNLLFLHHRVPEEVRAQTKRWYDGARKLALEWETKYQVPREVTAGVLAALSPQKDWFQNVELAQRVMDVVRNPPNGGMMTEDMAGIMTKWITTTKGKAALSKKTRAQIRDSFEVMRTTPFNELDTFEKAVWARAHSEAHLSPDYHAFNPEGVKGGLVTKKSGAPRKLAWSGFNNELSAAISILENPTRENISAQLGVEHKVRNFYNNILLPNDPRFGDVTIDTHAVAASLLRPLAGVDKEVKQNFGTSGGSGVLGVSGLYPIYAEAYRRAAKETGLLPRELQSITWEAVRGLFPSELKGKKKPLAGQVKAVWDDYAQGKITFKEAQRSVEKTAGGIRIPDWLGPGFRPHEETRPAADAGRVSGAERAGERAGDGGGGRGADTPDLPRRVRKKVSREKLMAREESGSVLASP
jgi:hypothetical protein